VSTTDLPPRITTHYAVAVDEGARRARQPVESFVGRPIVVRAPVFALVVPVAYTVQPPTPEVGLHPHGAGPIEATTGIVFALLVFLLLAGRVVVRLIRLGA
jgi:hypothetical protein